MHGTTVHLVTGPVQTGKTTRLLRWCTGRTDVDGILAPIVDGHRHLVRIATGETRDLESLGRGDVPVIVGPYTFSSQAFAWARDELRHTARRFDLRGTAHIPGSVRWLIIDEYGKLELRGEGLEPVVGEILASLATTPDSPEQSGEANVVLVIRDGLKEAALQRLGLDAANVVEFDLQ